MLGFIGQGWIGKNLADHFEERGFSVARYAKEAPHDRNRERIATCDLVFIAVPTPTTPDGFDDSVVRAVLPLVGKGKIAVIKSTVLPGTTDALQNAFPDITILHAPEFLREATVRHDIDHPDRNIVGIPSSHSENARSREAAELLLSILPEAPHTSVSVAVEAELSKYAANAFLFTKVVFMNILYDLATQHGVEWSRLRDNLIANKRIGASHMEPVHQLAHLEGRMGRGAGGHCFIKDFAAFRALIENALGDDPLAVSVARSLEAKNLELLQSSGKDRALVAEVYGVE